MTSAPKAAKAKPEGKVSAPPTGPGMLHLIRMAAGIRDLDGLRRAMAGGRGSQGIVVRTRNMPKRAAELMDGGSLYWIAGGGIIARQSLLDVSEDTYGDGSRCARLLLSPELVPVRPMPKRAFQGWRYEVATNLPLDMTAQATAEAEELPEALKKELLGLGLI